MGADQLFTGVAALTALIAAVAAIVANRRKPKLDEASIDQIKTKVNRDNLALNLYRDGRLNDLEAWRDQMRPAQRARDERIELLTALVIEDHEALGKTMPPLPPLTPWPEVPEPRPLPAMP